MLNSIYVHIHQYQGLNNERVFTVFLRSLGARSILAIVESLSFSHAGCGMNTWGMFMIVCVCVCVRVRMRACACQCALHDYAWLLHVCAPLRPCVTNLRYGRTRGGAASTKVPSLVHLPKNCERRGLRLKVPWKNWKIDVEMSNFKNVFCSMPPFQRSVAWVMSFTITVTGTGRTGI